MALVPNYCSRCCQRYFYEPGVHSDELCFACLSQCAFDNERLEAEIEDLVNKLYDVENQDCWGPMDSYEGLALALLFYTMGRLGCSN